MLFPNFLARRMLTLARIPLGLQHSLPANLVLPPYDAKQLATQNFTFSSFRGLPGDLGRPFRDPLGAPESYALCFNPKTHCHTI